MVSNESETDYNPRKRQGTLLSFFTNPIDKKSKADAKVKKNLMTEMPLANVARKKKCLLIFVGSKLNKVLHNFKRVFVHLCQFQMCG
jgi:hypothetical protein